MRSPVLGKNAACETCIDRCAFDAISMSDDGGHAQVDEHRCMGCGACTVTCPTEAIRLERFERGSIYDSTSELMMKFVAENEAAGQKSTLP
jgi:MinD superfamily P-loop ATPase